MKLHDLRPPEGSRTARTRVGRGIAAGKGKTAGRGTKGQKARAGGSIPPWFEGGQTPLHMRIPKLRGFKNRFKTDYEVVNVGDIARVVAEGRLPAAEAVGGRSKAGAPMTVNQDLLKDAGLIRTLNKPMKVLGSGELSVALFVVADAFTKSAREKIEGAGGSVNVLEIPKARRPALGVGESPTASAGPDAAPTAAPAADAEAEAAPAPRVRRPKADAAGVETASTDVAATPVANVPADAVVADVADPADSAESADASDADVDAASPIVADDLVVEAEADAADADATDASDDEAAGTTGEA
jgi:large subunit ribosomal protein L15